MMMMKYIRCCANLRGIYDFLLALNSNLTSIFNRSSDITFSFVRPYRTSLPGGAGNKRLDTPK